MGKSSARCFYGIGCLVIIVLTLSSFEVYGLKNNGNITTESQAKCSKLVTKTIESAYAGAPWALEMVDASAKPQPGSMLQFYRMFYFELGSQTTVRFLGNFDQCLDTNTGQSFKTLYCTVELEVQKLWYGPLTKVQNVTYDVCVPDACTGSDLVTVLQPHLDTIPGIQASIKSVTCRDNSLPPVTDTVVWIICGFLFFIALVIVATLYDSYCIESRDAVSMETNNRSTDRSSVSNNNSSAAVAKDEPGVMGQLLLPFSLKKNYLKLISTSDSADSISTVHGIRVLATLGIYSLHFHFFGEPFMDNNEAMNRFHRNNLVLTGLTVNNFFVDTFFMLSALLTTRSLLNKFTTVRPSLGFFLKEHYLHRYVRITPPYLATLFIHGYLSVYAMNGPFTSVEGAPFSEGLHRHLWWRNILYIDPISGSWDMMMKWAWYLSYDWVLYCVSPILILILYRYGKKGLLVPISLLFLSMVVTGVLSHVLKTPLMTIPMEDVYEILYYMFTHYFIIISHIGPYLVGVILGYVLSGKKGDLNVKKSNLVLGWMMILSLMVATFSCWHFHHRVAPLSNLATAVYNGTHRTTWCAFVAWIIFTCRTDFGGIINKFLSLGLFLPLSRLSFMFYLFHPIVLRVFFHSQRQLIFNTHYNRLVLSVGLTFIILLCCAAVHLVFEAPFINLEKAIKNIFENKNEERKKEL